MTESTDTDASVCGAVERGNFREQVMREHAAARQRLESRLADLSSLKSRFDAVRTAT